MQDTPCSEVVWRVLATHSIRQFPLHFPSRVLPCAITFQLDYTLRNNVLSIYFKVICLITFQVPYLYSDYTIIFNGKGGDTFIIINIYSFLYFPEDGHIKWQKQFGG